jgi:hypothetical protein
MSNGLNSGCCQQKPAYLERLSQLEEMVIARGRTFGSMIKLWPGNMISSVCYHQVKGNVVVVPLEPKS